MCVYVCVRGLMTGRESELERQRKWVRVRFVCG